MGLSLCKSEESEELDSKDVVKKSTPASSNKFPSCKATKRVPPKTRLMMKTLLYFAWDFDGKKLSAKLPWCRKKLRKVKTSKSLVITFTKDVA